MVNHTMVFKYLPITKVSSEYSSRVEVYFLLSTKELQPGKMSEVGKKKN